ncbi:MAG: alpha/beta fold hydrolase [Actinomycetota bacterium]
MEITEFLAGKERVRVRGGEVAYADVGAGPVALFVHGVFMNGLLWRNVISGLRSERRCIAIDLPAHGDTAVEMGEGFSLDAHADLLAEFLDALGIERVDLVGNDTGGAICQAFVVRFPERVRTLTLTNCDVDDNFPPDAFKPAIELAREGQLAPLIAEMTRDLELARSETGLGIGYEHPETITPEIVGAYLGRYADPAAGREVERRIGDVVAKDLDEVTAKMRELTIPTLVAWGTNDVFFDVKWAYWLRDNVPGVTDVVEIDGGKLFFVDERAEEFVPHLRRHWQIHRESAAAEGASR